MQSSYSYQSTFSDMQTFNHEQSLLLSLSIQTAYEQESPLSITYFSKDGIEHQFCGYVEQIDPYERWIQLRNGTLNKQIYFTHILHLDLHN